MTRIIALFLVVLFAVAASTVYPVQVDTKSNSLKLDVDRFNAVEESGDTLSISVLN